MSPATPGTHHQALAARHRALAARRRALTELSPLVVELSPILAELLPSSRRSTTSLATPGTLHRALIAPR
jgi:hypothetical protein